MLGFLFDYNCTRFISQSKSREKYTGATRNKNRKEYCDCTLQLETNYINIFIFFRKYEKILCRLETNIANEEKKLQLDFFEKVLRYFLGKKVSFSSFFFQNQIKIE